MPKGESVILEEEIDDDFEPSDEEILEYAKWLGMDMEREQELIWIAREGLKAPLPEHWKPCKTPEGEIYYFNFSNGESVWEHPCDEFYKNLYAEEKRKLEKKNTFQTPPGYQGGGHQHSPAGSSGRSSPAPLLEIPSGPSSRRGSLSPKRSPLGAGLPLGNPAMKLPDYSSANPTPKANPKPKVQSGQAAETPRMGAGLGVLLRRKKQQSSSPGAGGLSGLPSSSGVDGILDETDMSDTLSESVPFEDDLERKDLDARAQFAKKLQQEHNAWKAQLAAEVEGQKAKLEFQTKQKMEQEITEMEDQLEARKQRQVEDIKEQHEEAMQKLQDQLEEEEQEARRKHQGKLKQLQAADEKEIEQIKLELAQERSNLQEQHMEQVERMESEHRKALQAIQERVKQAEQAMSEGEKDVIRQRCRDEVEIQAREEARTQLEQLRCKCVEEMREVMEAEVAADADKIRKELLEKETRRIKEEAMVEAATLRGRETAEAMGAMRVSVQNEVQRKRAQLQAELLVQGGEEDSWPSQGVTEPDLEAKRREAFVAVEAKIAQEEAELLQRKRMEMESRVAVTLAAEEAGYRQSKHRETEGRTSVELMQEEAAMVKERRQEVVDRVVQETAEFEEALVTRLRAEATGRAEALAAEWRKRDAADSTIRDQMRAEVDAEVAREKKELLQAARRRVKAEVEAEIEHLQIRLRADARAASALESNEAESSRPWDPLRSRNGRKKGSSAGRHTRDKRNKSASPKTPMANDDASLVAMAKGFLQQQKRYLQERGKLLEHAREQWKRSVAETSEQQTPAEAQLMNFVKATLEEQTRRLNGEVRQLRRLKGQVRDMELGHTQVRDITPEVMDMRARAAAMAGSFMFSPTAAPQASELDTPGLSARSSTHLAPDVLAGDPGGLGYASASLGGWAGGSGGRVSSSSQWESSSSARIMQKMHGERFAVNSLLSTYSTWLKNMIDTVPNFSKPGPMRSEGLSLSSGAGLGLSHSNGDGAVHVNIGDQRELVIALRTRP